jgi:hypothetical protein
MRVSVLNSFERNAVVGDTMHLFSSGFYYDIECVPSGYMITSSAGLEYLKDDNRSLSSIVSDIVTNNNVRIVDINVLYNTDNNNGVGDED